MGYSPKEFLFAIKPEANIGSPLTSGMQLINIDSISMPEFNPVQITDAKHSVGRTAKVVDMFTCKYGTIKSITIEGTADKVTLPLLVQNVLTSGVTGSPSSYNIPANYMPPELLHNAPSSVIKTFTVALISPVSNGTILLPSCVVTNLVLRVNGIEDTNGLTKFTATFETRYLEQHERPTPTGLLEYSNDFYYIRSFSNKKKFAGVDNVVLDGLELTIKNQSKYEGFQGANADPQAISRAVPEIMVTAQGTIMYNAATKGLVKNWVDGDANRSIELSNNTTWTSATEFGIKADNAVITGVDWNKNTSMYLDVDVKIVADSGNMLELIV